MNQATVSVKPGGYGPLPKVCNELLRFAEAHRALSFDADRIIESARRSTGLNDFGGDDFREPLDVLLGDLREQPPAPLGRLLINGALTKALANRLRVQAAVDRGETDEVEKPLVIVGWHRSGTTFLHKLLAALPRYRFLPLYRLAEPVSTFGEKLKMALTLRGTWTVAPELRGIHHQSATGPEEDWTLMMGGLRVEGYVQHWLVPRYRRWLDQCDFGPAYDYFRRALRVAQFQHGPGDERLVLKDPAHLMALPDLLDALPDARLIWTHRDPGAMVASFASLSAIHHRSMYGAYDPERAGRSSRDRCERALRRGMNARDRVPDDQLVDVPYRRLKEAPIETVLDICDRFDIEIDSDDLTALERRLQQIQSSSRPRHLYSLEKWGLSPGELEERFSFYDAM